MGIKMDRSMCSQTKDGFIKKPQRKNSDVRCMHTVILRTRSWKKKLYCKITLAHEMTVI